ncbi:MAG: hypothetical protein ACI9WU_001265 [Myxococcota bacterium]|jgi:hypothetical protein
MTPDEPAPELDDFLRTLRLRLPAGLTIEVAHFKPADWSWEIEDGNLQVIGPWSKRWLFQVRERCHVLAYREGGVLRRLTDGHHEFVTWRNEQGDGFRVVFRAEVSQT